MKTRHLLILASALSVVLLSLACGGGDGKSGVATARASSSETSGESTTTTASAIGIDPCALVTVEDARLVTGGPLEHVESRSPLVCRYDVPANGGDPARPDVREVSVTVQRTTDGRRRLEAMLTGEAPEDSEYEAVDGIGELAVRWTVLDIPTELRVLKGDLLISIKVLVLGSAQDQEAAQEELARRAVSRL